MILDAVTRRYADALFELARDKGQGDAVQADVEKLAAALERPGVAHALFDARVDLVLRRSKVEELLTDVQPLTRNFVHLLFDKRREVVLRDLGRAFRLRSLVEQGAVEGVVDSPRPLGSAEIDQLAAALGKRLGKRVQLENRVASGLVAGVRVTVDNKMIDFSVKGRLEGLRRRMMESALPQLSADTPQ